MQRGFGIAGWNIGVAVLCGACSSEGPSTQPALSGGATAVTSAGEGGGAGSGGTGGGGTGSGGTGSGGLTGSGGTGSGGLTGSGGSVVIQGCPRATIEAACRDRRCGPISGCIETCGTCAGTDVCIDGTCSLPPCVGSACQCGSVDFTVATRASCSIGLVAGAKLDGEAFIDTGGGPQRVFAMNRWGKGHVIAWCDASTTAAMMEAFNAVGYLAQTSKPRVASFGNLPTCKPGELTPTSMPMDVTYLGAELPAKYTSDASALAADWDAIVFCGFHTVWDPGIAALIQRYVAELGRGYLAVMDYHGFDVTSTDFVNMTAISKPAGFVFNPVTLDWADLTASIKLDCVPDLPPPIR